MKLAVGLGNPGGEYRDTYHNIGFIALQELAARLNAPALALKGNARVCVASFGGERIVLCEPQTYMNLSGDAVAKVAAFYKIEPRDIIVIYDDIDMPKGAVRARKCGSAGTHNGMRDIVAKLGTQDFARVRIGTGLKPSYMELKDYVLAHIPQAEQKILSAACSVACDFVCDFIIGKDWQSLTVTAVAD